MIPIIFAIVNVSDMIPKYADAKEGQALYDSYSGFFDNTGDHLLLGTKTKTASYHIETVANNIVGAPSSVQENDTHMYTITSAATNISGEVRNRIENVTFPVLIIP